MTTVTHLAAGTRVLWRLTESYHSLVYFAPERVPVYDALGFKGGWMGYFATRSAALGTVEPAVVTACLYGFAPTMVTRALPDAWRYATPEQAVAGRLRVFDLAVRRVLGPLLTDLPLAAVGEDLADVVHALPCHGRPMAAAHAALERPDDPHLTLFWAATALREYRGDAHVIALQEAEVSPAASHVLMVALGLVPREQRTFRGWTEQEWDQATEALTSRGWLDDRGAVTPEGRRRRAAIEHDTDRLSAPAWKDLEEHRVTDLIHVLGAAVERIVTAGALPYPNGIGVAPATELAVTR
jgi:hypothetical protein